MALITSRHALRFEVPTWTRPKIWFIIGLLALIEKYVVFMAVSSFKKGYRVFKLIIPGHAFGRVLWALVLVFEFIADSVAYLVNAGHTAGSVDQGYCVPFSRRLRAGTVKRLIAFKS